MIRNVRLFLSSVPGWDLLLVVGWGDLMVSYEEMKRGLLGGRGGVIWAVSLIVGEINPVDLVMTDICTTRISCAKQCQYRSTK